MDSKETLAWFCFAAEYVKTRRLSRDIAALAH